MKTFHRVVASLGRTILLLAAMAATATAPAAEEADTALEKIGIDKGICVVLGLPEAGPQFVTDLAEGSDLIIYFQSPEADEVAGVQEAAEAAGLLGQRVFADRGSCRSVQAADNLAGAVIAFTSDVADDELLRVLHPEGKAIVGDRQITKPQPAEIDAWSHPYHGPDNNPQSTDRLARWPYLTQFLGNPKFCPMPEVSVAAGGRVFRAFGHIAHKANQNAMLNTLICANGYNGTILWQRHLKEGFMIHRNTMIATPEVLYLADDESCKLIDARTGKVEDEIVMAQPTTDGPVWKWMALEDGVFYALIGGEEVGIQTQPSQTPGLGHWPWGMWAGHDYRDPKTSFGYGRSLVAVDPTSKKILWNHRDSDYLDSRGVCMHNGRIYCYCPEKFLECVDANTGDVLWKCSDADLLEAIGPNGRAQHYVTGYATTTYIKCNDDLIFFAGPQRKQLVVASADDGKLLWKKEFGNLQLVLRDDGVYAAGPDTTGCKLDYATGEVLMHLPRRRACTRATGSIDSIFYRTPGGTVRFDTATNTSQHIAPMRPPCQDGVIISGGHLYWGPWMCGCQLSLYGHIGLAPAGEFDYRPGVDESRLEPGEGDASAIKPFDVQPGDWPGYCGNAQRSGATQVDVPGNVSHRWTFKPATAVMPTAPIVAGDVVFTGDRAGVVRAIGADGKLLWQAYTGGAIYFPPEIEGGRLFVGSADGRVHAFEAATGRRLWSFRVGPAPRRICVYGELISTWPVAGGVIAHDGVVYAAAGIAHYDGIHVVALDAATGKVRWYNDTSGTLSEDSNSGVSLQGNLYLRDGQLCFTGGGVCETARYDLATGKCLNQPTPGLNSQFQTSFYAYYPDYGKYLTLDHTLADGRSLCYDVSYEGSRHSRLAMLAPLPPGVRKPIKPVSRWGGPRGDTQLKALWADRLAGRYHGFIISPDVLVAAGETGQGQSAGYFLAAMDLGDGSDLWRRELPVAAVKGGTAIDHAGRIVVSLEDGRVVCFRGE